MNDLIEKLLVIQDRDSRIHKLAVEKNRLPLEIQNLDQRIAAARAKVEAAREKAKTCEKELKQLDSDASAKEETVKKFKTQLLTIKKNEEFHALQHEIQAVETDIRSLEDRELDLMEKLEAHKKEVQSEDAACKGTVSQLESQIADLQKRGKLIDDQLGEVEQERARLAGDVDAASLSLYERIMKSKKDAAIVGIHHGICQGCHVKITTQIVHHVKSNTGIVNCTNCGRILFWSPEMDQA